MVNKYGYLCNCGVCYGWKMYKCVKCGGDVRGVWNLVNLRTEVINNEEHIRKTSTAGVRG